MAVGFLADGAADSTLRHAQGGQAHRRRAVPTSAPFRGICAASVTSSDLSDLPALSMSKGCGEVFSSSDHCPLTTDPPEAGKPLTSRFCPSSLSSIPRSEVERDVEARVDEDTFRALGGQPGIHFGQGDGVDDDVFHLVAAALVHLS